MKSSPFVVACTFLLGALVSLLAVNALREPVAAASSSAGSGAVDNLNVVTVAAGVDHELLVVFKNVPNTMLKVADRGAEDKVTGMAVYDLQYEGTGRARIILCSTRFVDYDCMQYEWNNENGKVQSVENMKAVADKTKK